MRMPPLAVPELSGCCLLGGRPAALGGSAYAGGEAGPLAAQPPPPPKVAECADAFCRAGALLYRSHGTEHGWFDERQHPLTEGAPPPQPSLAAVQGWLWTILDALSRPGCLILGLVLLERAPPAPRPARRRRRPAPRPAAAPAPPPAAAPPRPAPPPRPVARPPHPHSRAAPPRLPAASPPIAPRAPRHPRRLRRSTRLSTCPLLALLPPAPSAPTSFLRTLPRRALEKRAAADAIHVAAVRAVRACRLVEDVVRQGRLQRRLLGAAAQLQPRAHQHDGVGVPLGARLPRHRLPLALRKVRPPATARARALGHPPRLALPKAPAPRALAHNVLPYFLASWYLLRSPTMHLGALPTGTSSPCKTYSAPATRAAAPGPPASRQDLLERRRAL